jgi:hypothetical protein
MSEETKKVEEVASEEINPIDEYLNNYKEQKLAEFCVQKDKHIKNLKRENHDYAKNLAEMKEKVERYDKTFENVKELYAEIKKLSVDDYLKLYHMMTSDVSGYCKTSIATIGASGLTTVSGMW